MNEPQWAVGDAPANLDEMWQQVQHYLEDSSGPIAIAVPYEESAGGLAFPEALASQLSDAPQEPMPALNIDAIIGQLERDDGSSDGDTPSSRGPHVRRTHSEMFFRVNMYPSSIQITSLAEKDGMTVKQANDWFINRRKRTPGAQRTKKPPMSTAMRPVLDWVVHNIGLTPPSGLVGKWADATGKSPAQIRQWINNQRKPGRKNALVTSGMRPSVV
jgi:hypothetical protein